jgi:hypothetical protein
MHHCANNADDWMRKYLVIIICKSHPNFSRFFYSIFNAVDESCEMIHSTI